MSDTKKPQLEHIGTVHIPVSQWKLGQTLLWLQRKGYENGEECPLDATMFPTKHGLSLDALEANDEVFHTFREVRFEESVEGELPQIVCVFDRMRLVTEDTDEGVVKPSLGLNVNPPSTDRIAREAKRILEDDHGIVINLKFLQEAMVNSSVYSESMSAAELVGKVLDNIQSQLNVTTEGE